MDRNLALGPFSLPGYGAGRNEMEHSEYDLHVTAQALMVTNCGNWPMVACFTYNCDDPLAVTVYIDPQEQPLPPIVWTFSRDLLVEAFTRPGQRQGVGDVRATYILCDDFLVLELVTDNRDSFVPISIEAEPVSSLLQTSLLLMHPQQARVDVDQMIAGILGAE